MSMREFVLFTFRFAVMNELLCTIFSNTLLLQTSFCYILFFIKPKLFPQTCRSVWTLKVLEDFNYTSVFTVLLFVYIYNLHYLQLLSWVFPHYEVFSCYILDKISLIWTKSEPYLEESNARSVGLSASFGHWDWIPSSLCVCDKSCDDVSAVRNSYWSLRCLGICLSQPARQTLLADAGHWVSIRCTVGQDFGGGQGEGKQK